MSVLVLSRQSGICLAIDERMDLWIGVEDRGDAREVRLEGRLAGEAVAELERATRKLEPPIRLDLSQLLSADEAGLAALRVRQEAGEEMVGARPLIQHFLDRLEEESSIRVNDAGRKVSS